MKSIIGKMLAASAAGLGMGALSLATPSLPMQTGLIKHSTGRKGRVNPAGTKLMKKRDKGRVGMATLR